MSIIRKAPVSLTLICKNEGPRLEECLQCFRPYVEEICIVDTGSTDNTLEIVQKYADHWAIFTKCNDPETGVIDDFSMARNKALSMATQPWVMWCDGDDRVENVDRLFHMVQRLNMTRQDRAIQVLLPYNYSSDDKGNVLVRQYRERLISPPSAFYWKDPIHEVLIAKNSDNLHIEKSDEILYIHNRGDKVTESGRNLRIIKRLLDKPENEIEIRHYYYGALEYFNNGDIENGVKYMTKYIDESGWNEEVVMAALRLSQHYMSIGDYKTSITYGLKCITEIPNWAEGYFVLGKCYYLMGNNYENGKNFGKSHESFSKSIFFFKQGLALPPTETVLFINPLERDLHVHQYMNTAYGKLGMAKEGLESAELGLRKDPNDPWLLCNRNIFQNLISRLEINKQMATMLSGGGIDQKKYDAIMAVFDKPEAFQSNFISELDWLTNSHLPVKNYFIRDNDIVRESHQLNLNNKLDIIFYCGEGLEKWSPETIRKNGIGGSELMEAQLAKELADLGHRVRVYCSCDNEGIYDGVEYRLTEKYRNLTCDVLVVSRNMSALENDFNIQAKLKLAHAHDVVLVNPRNDLLLKANRIIALTDWHKNNLMREHNLPDNQIIVSRNGIYNSRFDIKVERNQYKVINSSSPDRSWEMLLDTWGEIKNQVPQAELHLCYGFKNWEKIAETHPDYAAPALALRQRALDMKDLGVVYHDRLSQEQLATEFSSSGIWAAPTWFTETSCISAMEAQSAGCLIVCSALAALNETVGYDNGAILTEGYGTSEFKNKFIQSMVQALQNPSEEKRTQLKQRSRNEFEMIQLGKDWEQMFLSLISEIEKNPLVPYLPINEYK